MGKMASKNWAPNAAECHSMMFDRMLNKQDFIIPREIMDSLTLSPRAKLVYGVINSFGGKATLYRRELAGLCGLSVSQASDILKELKDAGLLTAQARWSSRGASGFFQSASTYSLVPPPRRAVNKKDAPRFINTDISNIEEELKDAFYDIEPEC